MRKILYWRLVYIIFPLLYNSAQSQPDHFAYAVTAIDNGGTEWVALRKVDTRTGDFNKILLNFHEINLNSYDFASYKMVANSGVNQQANNTGTNINPQSGLGNSVAAIAYDRKSNRLYYSPMNIDQLDYIDLNTMKIVLLDQFFSKAGKYDFKYGGPINRMVIAPDDYGYTVTTDGNHLIRFSTNETPVLNDLGELLDDPLNKEMSIHNPCANSGGDLIADDAGHLYLICGSNKVFKVDISTRITTYLATVTGLPQKFTTSGVAVNEYDKLLLSSSAYSDAYFIVDPETWNATPSQTIHQIYGSADLANSNVLHSKNPVNSNLFLGKSPEKNSGIKIFPNPLLFDIVSVQFNELPAGNYTIQIANVLGKQVIRQKVTVSGNSYTEIIHIPHFAAQGFYYIHILDENNKAVSTQKLVVERW